MTRHFGMLTLFFTVAGGTVFSWQFTGEDFRLIDESGKIGQVVETTDNRGRNLDDRIRRRKQFTAVVDAWVAKVLGGTASLQSAADGLIAYCSENYPEYLQQVDFVEDEIDLGRKVHRNLLRHFESMHGELGLSPAEQRRLRDILRQGFAPMVRQ